MSSQLDQIADAVAASLNAGSFSLEFESIRLPVVRLDLKDLKELQVHVEGSVERLSLHDRGSCRHEYDVGIAVQKQLAGIGAEDTAPLTALVDEIVAHFKLRKFDSPDVAWVGTAVTPYSRERMVQEQQFQSIVKVTFAGFR